MNRKLLSERLATYRPLIDRLVFGVALLGVLLTVHLGAEERGGFENGCFGFGEATSQTFNCAAVVGSEAGTLLGVSNVTWGFLFYLAVAVLSFGIAFAEATRRRRFKQARLGLIVCGFAYSAYLTVVQLTELEALCSLCLTSAGLTTTLLLLQASDLFRPKSSAMMERKGKREVALLSALAVATAVLAGADMTRSARQGAGDVAATTAAQATPPSSSEGQNSTARNDTAVLPNGCRYDTEKSRVHNPDRLVGMGDPVVGDLEAPVTVVEYFDPNCPHCKTFHPVMKQLQEQYGSNGSSMARFIYKPVPSPQFREASVPQINALYAANREGKFNAMLDAQLAWQRRGGLSIEQMRGIAGEIGLSPDTLERSIRQNIFRGQIEDILREAQRIGLSGTPKVLINGRFVARQSHAPRCLGAMIEAAAES